MQRYQEGDKSKAVCHACKGLRPTTFKMRDVLCLGTTVHILAGVCDGCGKVSAIPHQSTPAIKEAIAQRNKV